MIDVSTKEGMSKLTAISKSLTKKWDKPQLTDDFIQWASEAFLRGRKATVKQLFIDFIRQEYGDNRNVDTTKFTFNNSYEWEEYMDLEVEDHHNTDFSSITGKLKGNDRAIITLYYQWGFTLKEIGNVLGLTEGRVCQLFGELNKKLTQKYGNA